MSKTKTINVKYNPLTGAFVVQSITDSTEYSPGQEMQRRDVNTLCNARGWKVHIS